MTTNTTVAVLVPAAEEQQVSAAVCGECFGWGFIWAPVPEGEPVPGDACTDCGGTGVAW
ncbi:hypothetical protein ACWGA4_34830 [Streptomyces rubiginosohelvolus]|uniref:hypothetical protein n=1 Tax=Streptomyces sp. CB02130 TaxID=1703934 RepID=UPI000AE0AF6C|nr:hypothetical protein [Streptomyces sp. CB02130]